MHGTPRRAPRPASFWRRLGRRLGGVALGLLLLLVVLPPALLVALRFEAPRAFVARKLDTALASLFRGRLRIAVLERVDLGGVRVTGSIEDPAGRSVIRFQSVTVRASVPALLVSVIRGGGTPGAIQIDEVRIPHSEVTLVDGPDGIPTIAHAFDPRTPSAPTSGPSTPPPTLTVSDLRIDHAWVHGRVGSSPLLDAELSRASATLGLDPKTFHVELTDSRLVSRLEPYALDPRGKVVGALRVPFSTDPLSMKVTFEGDAAGTPVVARATLEGEGVSAEAHLAGVSEATLRRFVPGLSLRGTQRVDARAQGTLRELSLTLDAAGEAGQISAQGRLFTGPPLRVELTAAGKRWDASALAPTAPATSIDFDAVLALVSEDSGVRVRYDLAVQRPVVAGETLPSVTTEGALRAAGSELTLEGEVRAKEAGLDARGSYAVRLAGERGHVEVGLNVDVSNPPRLVALAGIRARGKATVRARLELPKLTVGGLVEARFDEIERGADRVGATRLHVEADGPLADPRLKGSVLASGAHVQGLDIASIVAGWAGTPRNAHVEVGLSTTKQEDLVLTTELGAVGAEVVLTGAKARFRDRHGDVDLAVGRASFGGQRIAVDELTLRGPGEAHASLLLEGSRWRVSARTDRLDLARLAQVARLRTPLRRARATLVVELAQARQLEGTVRGRLDGVSYGTVNDGKASLELEGRAEAWSGNITTELVPGARLDLIFRDFHALRLAKTDGPLPEGELRASGTMDLGGMTPLLAAFPAIPVENAHGRVDVELEYRREGLTSLPTLTGRIRTHDLELVEKREARSAIDTSEEAIQAAPSVYKGIDFGVDLALDAAARRLTAHLGFYDARAELLTVDASAGPWRDAPIAAIMEQLYDIPLEVRAAMPTRKLVELPPPLRPSSLRGRVAGDLTFEGTLREPHLVVDVRASRLAAATGARVQGEVKSRISVLGHVEYTKEGGKLALIADAARTRAVDADIRWSGDALRAISDPAELDRLVVSGDVVVDRFDLETVPALKNRQLEGVVSGALKLEYGPNKRAVMANLVAHPLRVGPATFDQFNLAVDAAPGHLRGAVDVTGRSGALRANVTSGLDWPAHGLPRVAGDSAAALSARQFRLAGLWPLFSGSVNELDGRLDADLGARVVGSNVTLSGSGRLADGVVQIPAVGQRFESISADIKVQPSAILIRNLRANGLTGQVQGQASVALDEHLALHRFDTELTITKNQKLPITVEGVAIGDAWGKVEAHLVNEPTRVSLRVAVPELHVEVPDSAGDGVQDLAPDASVRVGVHRADSVFAALPIQPIEPPRSSPTPIDVTIELGSVWVRKGDLVNAELTGAIHVAIREETQVTGRIDLKGGSLDVSGKHFEIERGTVTFTGGDPANPTVSALARWDAPSGYAVFATYTGTAKKGKLTLAAEPQLSQDEIVNLILFGTPEGSVSSGGGGTAAGAAGLAGSTAARGVNRAISDLTHLDIQARVDTSTGTARPELMVPVTPRLSARVTRAIGDPSPGSSPDRTFLTLELRLKRNWALSALLGDRGASALDLVWRRHY